MIPRIQLKHLCWRAGFGCTLEDWQKFREQSLDDVLKHFFREEETLTKVEVTEGAAPQLKDLMDMSKEERRELLQQSRKMIRALNTQWLEMLVKSESQLREKTAFFWHGHFACQARNVYHAQQYIQTLRKNALGKFGDLVLAVSKEPAMLQFLNNQQNRKRQPNENFARELMELFTIGRGNYTEQDIKESARAFTGWGFDGANFVFREQTHDFDRKTFMGQSGNFNGDDIIRIILENPKTADFITRKIYKFFVNPEVDEVQVSQLSKFFYDSGYDIKALMLQIFQSDWFYKPKNIGVHIKSPIELIVGLQRQLNLKFLNEDAPLFIQKLLGQMLLFPPNVAGWPGGKSWIDSSSLLLRLKIPDALYKASEIQVSTKEDGDVQNEGLVKDKITRFQGEYDWTAINRYTASRTNPRDLYREISDFLLLQNTPELEEYAFKVLQENNGSDPVKTLSILQCCLPEYQLC